jgi:superfamily II DNA or RNA helicase
MVRIHAEEIHPPIPPQVLAEARRLVGERRIRLLEGAGEDSAEAEADFFRRRHRVWVERQGGRVAWECTCPALENTGAPCAHIAGLLLLLEERAGEEAAETSPRPEPLDLVLLLHEAGQGGALRIGLGERLGPRIRPVPADAPHIFRVTDPAAQALLRVLGPHAGGRRPLDEGGGFRVAEGPWGVPPGARGPLLLSAARAGRLHFAGGGGPASLASAPAELLLDLREDALEPDRITVVPALFHEGRVLPLDAPRLLAGGPEAFARAGELVLPVEGYGAEAFLDLVFRERPLAVPEAELGAFLSRLAASGPLPRLRLPGAAQPLPLQATPPRGVLHLRRRGTAFEGAIRFSYGAQELLPESPMHLILGTSVQIPRDAAGERLLEEELHAFPCVEGDPGVVGRVEVAASEVEELACGLVARGWSVALEGRPVRAPGREPRLRLASGPNWLELSGSVEFEGGGEVDLGLLFAAHRRGEKLVPLPDGSRGVPPEELLERLARAAALAADPDRLRFQRAQALLLEPLLGVDLGTLSREAGALRAAYAEVSAPPPARIPEGFRGTLRPYQVQGLAWLQALEQGRLGGCLADEMGLGKTVQVLAWLLSPPPRAPSGPALIVAPRSLLWNWQEEAGRFAPGLRVTVHHGGDRSVADLAACDLVLTTYGTVQRDSELLRGIRFRCVVLDEAQAVKNSRSQSHAAVLALEADHRLAVTGTPVENSIRDLWALMEFANPGLLGTERRFLDTRHGRGGAEVSALMRRALAPLILRRTKAEVAAELPPRIEQTLHCELPREERALYAAIEEEARRTLAFRDREPGGSLHVLEALLRLRQAACHPGLLLPEAEERSSAKLDLLLDRLEAALDAGEKAIVTSQFVRFLRLVRREIERREIPHAYLDGEVRDRKAPVRRFQEDEDCAVILLSLKAGGVGLNLTRASCVFLLDPWWNPAVEAQAIDRAHRIGQTRTVVAYRLVARNTVEDRILELQVRKRELAEAVVAGSAGPLAALTEEDLRLLLGF